MDADELDILVISSIGYPKGSFLQGYIIGALVMEDEKGMDEKILIVPTKEFELIKDISDINPEILKDIEWFFANYKNHEKNKWSKTFGFINAEKAFDIFEKSLIRFIDQVHLPV
jgi:inorganic pyrophosphatase